MDRFSIICLLFQYQDNERYTDTRTPIKATHSNDKDTYYLDTKEEKNIIAIVNKSYDKGILINEINLKELINRNVDKKLKQKIHEHLYENNKEMLKALYRYRDDKTIQVEFTGYEVIYYLENKADDKIIALHKYEKGIFINEINLKKLINHNIETNLKEKIIEYLK